MTVTFIDAGKDAYGVRYKCFLGDGPDAVEFYISVDWMRGRMTFQPKEANYAAVLIKAFTNAMRE